jgi:multiple sugar transport system permease protein
MKRKKTLNRLLLFALSIPIFLFIYAPIAWLVIASVSTRADLLKVPFEWIPQAPTLQNYINIITPGGSASEVARTFKITIKNSFLVSSSVTLICLIAGSLAAYALVRIRFLPFRRTIMLGIMGTRMVPEISLVIPLYVLASKTKVLINTPYVLILTYLSFAIPFAIWLMASFFETIPGELEDAARIDGCTRFQTLVQIILPISSPGLVSTALFIFLGAWDEFFFALIFTSTIAAKTVPVAIAEFTGRFAVDITAMMTAGLIAAVPPVLLSLIFQRYIVSGLTAGAVKG